MKHEKRDFLANLVCKIVGQLTQKTGDYHIAVQGSPFFGILEFSNTNHYIL